MGVYTKFEFAATLNKRGVEDPDVIRVLNHIVTGDLWGRFAECGESWPSHPLFSCERWYGLGCDCDDQFGEVVAWELSHIRGDDVLIRGSFKNYDQEIQRFLDWVAPYIEFCDGATIAEWQVCDVDSPYCPIGAHWRLVDGRPTVVVDW